MTRSNREKNRTVIPCLMEETRAEQGHTLKLRHPHRQTDIGPARENLVETADDGTVHEHTNGRGRRGAKHGAHRRGTGGKVHHRIETLVNRLDAVRPEHPTDLGRHLPHRRAQQEGKRRARKAELDANGRGGDDGPRGDDRGDVKEVRRVGEGASWIRQGVEVTHESTRRHTFAKDEDPLHGIGGEPGARNGGTNRAIETARGQTLVESGAKKRTDSVDTGRGEPGRLEGEIVGEGAGTDHGDG